MHNIALTLNNGGQYYGETAPAVLLDLKRDSGETANQVEYSDHAGVPRVF